MIVLNHKNLKDEDLLMQVSTGDQIAFLELVRRYQEHSHSLAKKHIGSFSRDGLSISEVECIAQEALIKALKKYHPTKGTFYAYWKQVAIHSIQDFANKFSYNIGAKAFNGLSLNDSAIEINDYKVKDIGEQDYAMYDKIVTDDFLSYVAKRENKKGNKTLKVLKLLIEGYNVNEISKILKISNKTTYYHISVIKDLYLSYNNK